MRCPTHAHTSVITHDQCNNKRQPNGSNASENMAKKGDETKAVLPSSAVVMVMNMGTERSPGMGACRLPFVTAVCGSLVQAERWTVEGRKKKGSYGTGRLEPGHFSWSPSVASLLLATAHIN